MRRAIILSVSLIVLFAFSMTALAQSGGSYTLTWFTVDGGGGNSGGGSYALGGTIGQPDAATMTGGAYALGGGFWGGGVVVPVAERYSIYLPLVLK